MNGWAVDKEEDSYYTEMNINRYLQNSLEDTPKIYKLISF